MVGDDLSSQEERRRSYAYRRPRIRRSVYFEFRRLTAFPPCHSCSAPVSRTKRPEKRILILLSRLEQGSSKRGMNELVGPRTPVSFLSQARMTSEQQHVVSNGVWGVCTQLDDPGGRVANAGRGSSGPFAVRSRLRDVRLVTSTVPCYSARRLPHPRPPRAHIWLSCVLRVYCMGYGSTIYGI